MRCRERGKVGLEWGEEELCGLLLLGVLESFDESGDGTRKMSIWDTLEGLGFPDGGTERDTVVVVENAEGFGGSREVIEGAVGVGEVHNVLGDGDIVVAVVAGFVLDSANVGNDAREGLAGVDGVGTGDDGEGLGGLGVAEGFHLCVVGGENRIGEGAEGAAGGVARLDGLEAIVGEGRALLVVLGLPEGDDFFFGEEVGIVAVAVGGGNGVEGFPRGEDGFDGFGGRKFVNGAGGVEERAIAVLLVPLEEAVGAEGYDGNEGGNSVAEGIVLEAAKFLFGAVAEGDEGVAVGLQESGRIYAEVFLGAGGADLEDFVCAGVAEEVVGLAVCAGSVAVVAEVGAEIVHEVVGIGFVVAENLLYAVLEGDGAEIGVFNIVLLDGGKTLAVDVADFYETFLDFVVAESIALKVIFKGDGDGADVGEGVGNRGLAVLGENTVEVLHLLDEGILLGDPECLGEVREVEGVGEGGGFGSHGLGFLSGFVVVCLVLVCR